MKKIAFLIVLFLMSLRTYAEVPHYINLQSMIFDMDGNITTSDFVGITVRIVDADGNELYTETHPNVVVQNGAINLVIGSASVTGELPPDILNPDTGVKFLDVMVDGTSPFGLMTLSSVPYAIYADRAMSVVDNSIESRHIKDGTIELRDLKPGIAFGDITGQVSETQIPTSFTMDSELRTHISASPAHPASAISLSGAFSTMVANNVQTAVERLDIRLSDEIINRRTAVRNTNDQLTSGNTGLQDQINAEVEARGLADITLQNNIGAESVSRSGDSIYGNLTFYEDATLADWTLRLSPSTGDISSFGGLALLGGMMRVEADAVTGEPAIVMEDTSGTERLRFDGEMGVITADTIQTSGGVDVAGLQGQITSHANATSAHGVSSNIVGLTDTQTLSNKTLNSPAISGGSIIANVSVSDGVTIDGVDVSAGLDAKVSKSGDIMSGELLLPDVDPPTANYANRNGIVRAWGNIRNNGSILGSYNISSVSHYSTGWYTVYWNTDFLHEDTHAVVATTWSSNYNCGVDHYLSARAASVNILDLSFNLVDASFNLIAIGDQ